MAEFLGTIGASNNVTKVTAPFAEIVTAETIPTVAPAVDVRPMIMDTTSKTATTGNVQLSKKIRLLPFALTAGTATGTLAIVDPLMELWKADNPVYGALNYHSLVQTGFDLTITHNAPPSTTGMVVFFFLPPYMSTGGRTKGHWNYGSTPIYKTMVLATQKEVTINVPYSDMTQMHNFDAGKVSDERPRFGIFLVAPIKTATGASTGVSFTMYLSPDKLILAGIRPRRQGPPTSIQGRVLIEPGPGNLPMANAHQTSARPKLGLFGETIRTDVACTGFVPEKNLMDYAKLFGIIDVIEWAAQGQDGLLRRISMNPLAGFSLTGSSTAVPTPHTGELIPIEYIGKFYALFRGSLQLGVQIISAPLMQGRLMISYIPILNVVDHTSTAYQQSSYLWELGIGSTDIHWFDIPYIQNKPFITARDPNGFVRIAVDTPLTTNGMTPTTVSVLLYIRAGPDAEYRIPKGSDVVLQGKDWGEIMDEFDPDFTWGVEQLGNIIGATEGVPGAGTMAKTAMDAISPETPPLNTTQVSPPPQTVQEVAAQNDAVVSNPVKYSSMKVGEQSETSIIKPHPLQKGPLRGDHTDLHALCGRMHAIDSVDHTRICYDMKVVPKANSVLAMIRRIYHYWTGSMTFSIVNTSAKPIVVSHSHYDLPNSNTPAMIETLQSNGAVVVMPNTTQLLNVPWYFHLSVKMTQDDTEYAPAFGKLYFANIDGIDTKINCGVSMGFGADARFMCHKSPTSTLTYNSALTEESPTKRAELASVIRECTEGMDDLDPDEPIYYGMNKLIQKSRDFEDELSSLNIRFQGKDEEEKPPYEGPVVTVTMESAVANPDNTFRRLPRRYIYYNSRPHVRTKGMSDKTLINIGDEVWVEALSHTTTSKLSALGYKTGRFKADKVKVKTMETIPEDDEDEGIDDACDSCHLRLLIWANQIEEIQPPAWSTNEEREYGEVEQEGQRLPYRGRAIVRLGRQALWRMRRNQQPPLQPPVINDEWEDDEGYEDHGHNVRRALKAVHAECKRRPTCKIRPPTATIEGGYYRSINGEQSFEEQCMELANSTKDWDLRLKILQAFGVLPCREPYDLGTRRLNGEIGGNVAALGFAMAPPGEVQLNALGLMRAHKRDERLMRVTTPHKVEKRVLICENGLAVWKILDEETLQRQEGMELVYRKDYQVYRHYGVKYGNIVYHVNSENVASALLHGDIKMHSEEYDPEKWVTDGKFGDENNQYERLQEAIGKKLDFSLDKNCEFYARAIVEGKGYSNQTRIMLYGFVCTTILLTYMNRGEHQGLKSFIAKKMIGLDIDEMDGKVKQLSSIFNVQELSGLASTISNAAIKLVIISLLKFASYIILLALNPTVFTGAVICMMIATDAMLMNESRLCMALQVMINTGRPEDIIRSTVDIVDKKGVVSDSTSAWKRFKKGFRTDPSNNRQGKGIVQDFNAVSMAGKNVEWWAGQLRSIWQWFRSTFFPNPGDQYAKFVEEKQEEIAKTLVEADLVIGTVKLNSSITRCEDFRDRYLQCYKKLVLYRDRIQRTSNAKLAGELGRAIAGLSRITFPAFRPCQPLRCEPVAVCFVGDPGQGKSQLMSKLAVTLARAEGDMKSVYSSSKNCDFWDGYYGQVVHCMDDINQIKPEEDLVELCNLISGNPYVVAKADLAEKGQLYVSKYLLATSNASDFYGISTVKTPEALQRRFRTIHVRCASKFQNTQKYMDMSLAIPHMNLGACWEISYNGTNWFTCDFKVLVKEIQDTYDSKFEVFKKIYPEYSGDTANTELFHDAIEEEPVRHGKIGRMSAQQMEKYTRTYVGTDPEAVIYAYNVNREPIGMIVRSDNLKDCLVILGSKWAETIQDIPVTAAPGYCVLEYDIKQPARDDLKNYLDGKRALWYSEIVQPEWNPQEEKSDSPLDYGGEKQLPSLKDYPDIEERRSRELDVLNWIKRKYNEWKDWIKKHEPLVTTLAIIGTMISVVASCLYLWKHFTTKTEPKIEAQAAYAGHPLKIKTNTMKRQGRMAPEGWEHIVNYIALVDFGFIDIWAFMLNDNVLVTNMHFVRHFKRAHQEKLAMQITAPGIDFKFTTEQIEIESNQVDEDPTDLVLIRFKKQAQIFRRGINVCVDMTSPTSGLMIVPTQCGFEKKLLGTVKVLDLKKKEVMCTKEVVDNIERYRIEGQIDPYMVLANIGGKPGYCGLPWLVKIDGTWKVIGIHSAGSSAVSMAAPLLTVRQFARQGKTVAKEVAAHRAFMSAKTKLKPSPAHDAFPVKMGPSVLHHKDPRLEVPVESMIKLAADKYNNDIFEVDETAWKLAQFAVTSKLKSVIGRQPPVDVITAINSDEMQEGIDMKTSPGHPWNIQGKKKKDLFIIENNKMKPSPELQSAIDVMREDLGPYTVPFQACLKDEKRKLEKIATGKTRCIEAAPVEYVCIYRSIMKRIYDMIYNTDPFATGIAVGINPYTYGPMMHAVLLSKKSVVTLDYQTFDGSIPSHVMEAAVECLAQCSTVPEQVIQLHKPVVYSKHLVLDEWQYNSGGMPSGSPCTSVLNSICNLLVVYYTALVLGTEDLVDHQITTYGDDVIIATNEPEIFGMNFVETIKNSFGMTVTREDKLPVDEQHGLQVEKGEASFLKRSIVYNTDLNIQLMLLHKEVIEQSVMFMTNEDAFQEQLNQLCVEASGHGSHYYEEFRKRVDQKLDKHTIMKYELAIDLLGKIVGA